MPNFEVHGDVSPGFESVKAMFVKNFKDGKEENAQCCVYVGEEKVVDLWGKSSPESNYNGDTLQTVFSSTKSLAAIVVASLVDRKLINYGDNVSKYWPEFAQNGKGSITIADVLRHEGGIPYLTKTLKVTDLLPENIKKNNLGDIIAAEKVNHPPQESGTRREYHAITRGWMLNEIFRRVDPQKRTIGEYLKTEISEPLGADAYIGVNEDLLKRSIQLSSLSLTYITLQSCIPQFMGRKVDMGIAEFIGFMKVMGAKKPADRPVDAPLLDTMMNVGGMNDIIKGLDDPQVKRGEMPSANGQCSARGLAKIAAAMANKGAFGNVRIMSEETWKLMHHEPKKQLSYGGFSNVNDFSQGGVNNFNFHAEDPNGSRFAESFGKLRQGYWGWLGLGGSVFQWHPVYRIGFAYTPTLLHWYDVSNTRGAQLQKEVVECVKKRNGQK